MEFKWLRVAGFVVEQPAGRASQWGIDVVAIMVSLTSLWLQGNAFTGTFPENIRDLSSLKDLNLNGNNLIGLVPQGLGGIKLDMLDLNNNRFMGPILDFKAVMVSYYFNDFCVSKSWVLLRMMKRGVVVVNGALVVPLWLFDVGSQELGWNRERGFEKSRVLLRESHTEKEKYN